MDNFILQYRHVKSILRIGNNAKSLLVITIPTYNNLPMLKRVLLSCVNQKESKIDYCILIVDNTQGNIEATLDEIKKISNQYPHSKILYYQNEENIGMFPNWNRCFELAYQLGEYALMIHTDDYLLPNCMQEIEKLIQLGIKNCYLGRISVNTNRAIEAFSGSSKYPIIRLTKKSILLGLSPVAPSGFLISTNYFINSVGFNTDSYFPADLDYAITMSYEIDLYYYKLPLIVKENRRESASSNLKITVPFVHKMLPLLKKRYKDDKIFFKSFLIYSRTADTSLNHFNINYDKYLTDLFPHIYTTKIYGIIYRIYKKIIIKLTPKIYLKS